MAIRNGEPRGRARTGAAGGLAICMWALAMSATGSEGRSGPARISAGAASTPALASEACGPEGVEVLARTDGLAAQAIYRAELDGKETREDKRQVEQYGPLLTAVASGNRAAINTAVTSLVYSHTHIVRLRVTRGGVVLADVGGPYILAPVRGVLRFHSQTLARYVLSVQDDLGYVKLETRFVGDTLVLRRGSHSLPIEGALLPGPSLIPDLGPVRYRHLTYEALSFNATSFPTGVLRISLLMRVPASFSRKTCSAVRRLAIGRIARRVARRFGVLTPADLSPCAHLTKSLTGALVFIRSGSHQLAGSSPGPRRLPTSGSIDYAGATYDVDSFSARTTSGGARVYVLTTA